jgi:hypothetical protein
MYTLQESEESICGLGKQTAKMQMKAIGNPARPAEASVGGWVAVDIGSQKKHVWLNDKNGVYVNKTIKAKPKFFTLLIERSKDPLVGGISSPPPTLLEHLDRGQGKPLTLSSVNARRGRHHHPIPGVARN